MMSKTHISRRAVVPGLAAGAGITLAGAVAAPWGEAASPGAGPMLTGGPCGLWREQTLHFAFFLPAVQVGGRTPTSRFRLSLSTLEGQTILTQEFSLVSGAGTDFQLAA